jgi:hypothetical protein
MHVQSRAKGIACFLLFLMVLFVTSYAAGRFGIFQGDGLGLAEPKIAVIPILGVLTDAQGVLEELERYKERADVKALVFRIDSPGGTVVAAQEIYSEIRKLRGKKKTLSSMGNVAASGGYYVASATEEILANPGTITGSIGVISEYANVQDLLKKIGFKSTVLKSGRFKDVGSPRSPGPTEACRGNRAFVGRQGLHRRAGQRDRPCGSAGKLPGRPGPSRRACRHRRQACDPLPRGKEEANPGVPHPRPDGVVPGFPGQDGRTVESGMVTAGMISDDWEGMT